MTAYAADVYAYPVKAARRDVYEFECTVTIGASGAVSAVDADDPAVNATKDAGTGVYNLTFPIAKKGRLYVGFKSVVGTVKTYWLVTFDATAGTAQLAFGNGGGTATNPASGDVFWFLYRADSRAD
jgi:hypothetical protein